MRVNCHVCICSKLYILVHTVSKYRLVHYDPPLPDVITGYVNITIHSNPSTSAVSFQTFIECLGENNFFALVLYDGNVSIAFMLEVTDT